MIDSLLRVVAFGGGGTVWGPCPGCNDWSLEASSADLYTYSEPIYGLTSVVLSSPFWVVEEALREHMGECPTLAEIYLARLNGR